MDSPTDVTKPGWSYLLRRSAAEFSRDQLTDKAAALTYYGVLSIFPALIALVSILGLLGQGQLTTNAIIDSSSDAVPPAAAVEVRGSSAGPAPRSSRPAARGSDSSSACSPRSGRHRTTSTPSAAP